MSPQSPAGIPAAPNIDTGGPQGKRQVLFQLGSWELVVYRNQEDAVVVHTCREDESRSTPGELHGPSARRAVAATNKLLGWRRQSTPAKCWNCDREVPVEMLTVMRLYNDK